MRRSARLALCKMMDSDEVWQADYKASAARDYAELFQLAIIEGVNPLCRQVSERAGDRRKQLRVFPSGDDAGNVPWVQLNSARQKMLASGALGYLLCQGPGADGVDEQERVFAPSS